MKFSELVGQNIFREIISGSLLGMALATSFIFLEGVGKLFELLVRSSPRPETILYLFALSLPPLLPFTIPFGTLVGILVGLGRLVTAGEITAMRTAGSCSRKVVLPVMLFAFLAMLVAGAMTLRLTPLSIRLSKDLLDKVSASQVSAEPPVPVARRPFSEMNTRELRRYSATGPDWVEARIELHRRLALPIACLVLALVAIPLGVSSRKDGKLRGYGTAVFLVFFCYYPAFITLVNLARARGLRVEVALWLPNAAFLVAGLIAVARMETPGGRDFLGGLIDAFGGALNRLRARLMPELGQAPRTRSFRRPLLPQIAHILTNFVFYFTVLLASFVCLSQISNFFVLLVDIVLNRIPLAQAFTYLFFLTPRLIYNALPISVLVGVLVTFGGLAEHNEVTTAGGRNA